MNDIILNGPSLNEISQTYASGWIARKLEFDPRKEQDNFRFFRIQTGPGALSDGEPGGKASGAKADDSFSYSVEVNNEWRISPLPHTSPWRGS